MATLDFITEDKHALQNMVDAFELTESIKKLSVQMWHGPNSNLDNHELGALIDAGCARLMEHLETIYSTIGFERGYMEIADRLGKLQANE